MFSQSQLAENTVITNMQFLEKESNEEFVWWKLDKTFFSSPYDIFICSVYIPPQNSTRETRLDIDHYEILGESSPVWRFQRQNR